MTPIRQGDGVGLTPNGIAEVRKGDGTVLWSAAPDIPDSGISRYEFEDDTQASTLIDSWANNDGTLSGATYVNGGLSFDGTNDFGDIPNAAIPFSSGEWSIALRINDSTTASREAYFGIRDSGGSSVISIEHNSEKLLVERFESGTTANIITTVDLRDGSDHLIALAEDSNGAELFTDDGNSRGTASALTFDFGGEDPSVGRRGGGGGDDRYSQMTGLDLRTYNKRLTSSEVSNLYNTGSISG